MKNKIILTPSLLFLWLNGIWGQKVIQLENPSFEADRPSCCIAPSGWINLGATDQTPPDIQPGFFRVELKAQEGDHYLGMVVRETNTWEGVGQKLNGSMKKDSSYRFSLWLTRSIVYSSPTRMSTEMTNFTAPTILKIWGYNTKTKQEELLAESQPVGHSKWTRFEFVLNPTVADFDELDLMAYYAPGYENKNGNLMVDNCSAIELIEK